MSSGVRVESLIRANRWRAFIQGLQSRFDNQLGELIPTLERCGYAGESEIRAKLEITESGYQVFFPEYRVLADLLLDPVETCAYRF